MTTASGTIDLHLIQLRCSFESSRGTGERGYASGIPSKGRLSNEHLIETATRRMRALEPTRVRKERRVSPTLFPVRKVFLRRPSKG